LTIETVSKAIVDLGEHITGIYSASEPPPDNLDTFQLPCLMVWAGRAVDDPQQGGDAVFVETRLYRVQVAVSPKGQGLRSKVEEQCRDLIPTVKNFFRARANLVGLAWVQSVKVTGDSGVVQLAEYDNNYLGFEIYLEVTEYVQKTFVD
jgi:hypothetical protein